MLVKILIKFLTKLSTHDDVSYRWIEEYFEFLNASSFFLAKMKNFYWHALR